VQPSLFSFPRFQGVMSNSFYRGTDAVVLVFDVSRKGTFDALLQWKNSFLIQTGHELTADFPMLVVANKVDRTDRAVSKFLPTLTY
jgi:GTPase SAR1 family protein